MDDMAKTLALLAHRAAINEIAEIQARMAQRKIIGKMHGDKALPIREFFRVSLSSRQQALADAPSLVQRERESDEKRLGVLYDLVAMLEAKFKEYHEADDEAFMNGIVDFIRRRRQGE